MQANRPAARATDSDTTAEKEPPPSFRLARRWASCGKRAFSVEDPPPTPLSNCPHSPTEDRVLSISFLRVSLFFAPGAGLSQAVHAKRNLKPCTAVYTMDIDRRVRHVMTYPPNTGRNFYETLRAIDSMQLTLYHQVRGV